MSTALPPSRERRTIEPFSTLRAFAVVIETNATLSHVTLLTGSGSSRRSGLFA
jgi:hypothetical protein